MALNLFARTARQLAPLISRPGVVGLSVAARQNDKGESAKAAFQKLFPRLGGAKRLKPRYDANSYGQTVGDDYPFDVEKTPEAKVKREKSKGKIGAVSIEEVIEILEQKEAQDIKIMRLPDDLNYADYFVIANGKNSDHLKELTQSLSSQLTANHKNDGIHVEGLGSFDWMVVDAGSVVTHLFLPHIRDDYNIEEAWTSNNAA